MTILTHKRPIFTHRAAFTATELLVTIAIIFALAILLFPGGSHAHGEARRISCVNNLKQIGTAYRFWANDHGDRLPMELSETNGGWFEDRFRGNASAIYWTNYVILRNQLGDSAKVFICPCDERQPALDLAHLTNNLALSYFEGVDVNNNFPQGILSGDRNLAPGLIPHDDYGYSPTNSLGADVVIKSNVCWSLKMHTDGNSGGAGNILLGDGSAQQVTSASFRINWFKSALQNGPTNYGGLRLIFP